MFRIQTRGKNWTSCHIILWASLWKLIDNRHFNLFEKFEWEQEGQWRCRMRWGSEAPPQELWRMKHWNTLKPKGTSALIQPATDKQKHHGPFIWTLSVFSEINRLTCKRLSGQQLQVICSEVHLPVFHIPKTGERLHLTYNKTKLYFPEVFRL